MPPRRPVLVAGLRTPFAKSGTIFRNTTAVELARRVTQELIERTNLDGKVVDEVAFGQVIQSVLAPNVAREVSLLPQLPKCHHYCEPFAGSGAVLLNRDPAAVETYNDIDGDVVNFFKTLRERPEELQRAIALTPFSREEFHRAIYGSTRGISDLERARRFYVRARQARTGLAQTATLGRWANCKNTSRAGMSGVVSRWLGGVDGLAEIGERLLRVQIENRPATEILELYDSPTTLFYCDPPYLHSTRGDSKAYGYELLEPEHTQLAEALHRVKGKVALSGYRSALYDKLFKGWRRYDAPAKQIHSVKQERQECLWMNY